MAMYAVSEEQLTNIADMIRTKRDITDGISVDDMPMQIGLISGDGLLESLEHIDIEVTEDINNMATVLNSQEFIDFAESVGSNYLDNFTGMIVLIKNNPLTMYSNTIYSNIWFIVVTGNSSQVNATTYSYKPNTQIKGNVGVIKTFGVDVTIIRTCNIKAGATISIYKFPANFYEE